VKVVVPLLCILVALGVVYGMALTGILPAQKWADKNPQIAPLLRAIHLAKATKARHVKLAAAATAKPAVSARPLPAPIAPLPAPIAPLPVSAPAFAAVPSAPAPDTHAKLDAIYAAMAPDDLARIFTKLPDNTVVQSLMPMDEKKAGKVLAALPDDRAARLSRLMLASPVRTSSSNSLPASSLP